MFITATCCTSINIAAQAKTPVSWEKHKTKHQMSQASPSPKAHILSPKKAWLAERDWQWIWEATCPMVLMVPQPRSSAPVGLSQGWGGQSYPVPGSGLTQPGPWLWLRVCLLHLEQPVCKGLVLDAGSANFFTSTRFALHKTLGHWGGGPHG